MTSTPPWNEVEGLYVLRTSEFACESTHFVVVVLRVSPDTVSLNCVTFGRGSSPVSGPGPDFRNLKSWDKVRAYFPLA